MAVCFLILPPIAYLTSLIMGWCGVSILEAGGNALNDIFEPGTPWYVLLLTMLVVGILEEAYFRLMIMDHMFMRWLRMPYWLALILSSMSFGFAHLANGPWQVTLPQVVGTAFCGLWFARVYRRDGLPAAMLTHGLYNFVVCMLYFHT